MVNETYLRRQLESKTKCTDDHKRRLETEILNARVWYSSIVRLNADTKNAYNSIQINIKLTKKQQLNSNHTASMTL